MKPEEPSEPDNSLSADATRLAIPISARLTSDEQFRGYLETLVSLLQRSRDSRNDAHELLGVQVDMANFLLSSQEAQKRLEAELDRTPSHASRERKELKVLIGVCKRLQGIVRQIADGIAWRSLAYDRPVLHLLALKPHTGHMDRSTAITEFAQAETHVARTSDRVVLNDLTNFLRYGDFTSVGADGVRIHEVKAGRGAAKSGRATRQKRRTAEVLEFIERGFTRTEEGLRRIVLLDTQPVSHLAAVKSLLRAAREDGAAEARLSDCLAVQVFETSVMADEFDRPSAERRARIHNPFEHSRDARVFDTLKLFTRFTWNVAPYSVFPITADDSLAIMTGRLWLISYFNLGNLVRCLRRRNLLVKPPTKEGYANLRGLLPGQIARRELDNPLMVSRGRPHPVLKIPIASLTRLFYEFLDEESFADGIEEELDLPDIDEPTFLHTAFRAEAQLWD